jgi:5'-nucleotidase / UDP-sugar diphosphatase
MKKLSAKILVISLVAAMIASCAGSSSGSKVSLDLEIISTNDLHGYALSPSETSIGYDRIANYVEFVKESHANVLLMDAGDYIQGSALTNLSKGSNAIKAMNAAGYDIATIGNHEFDFGGDHLIDLARVAQFPIVSANVQFGSTKPFPAYHTFSLGDAKIAVIGMTTPETYWKTSPNSIVGWTFELPADSLRPLVERLRKDHDLIVVLAHLGNEGDYTSRQLAADVAGIDLILDGHDHTATPEGIRVGDTFIMNSGYHAAALAHTSIKIEDGKIQSISGRIYDVSAEELNAGYEMRPRAQEVQRLLAEIDNDSRAVLQEVVLTVPIALEGTRDIVRTSETNLGRLIADSMRSEAGTQLAMVNGGSIRTSIAPGDVTLERIWSVLPFNNTINSVMVTGEQLRQALEHGLSDYPTPSGGFPHVAGFTYSYNLSAPVGNRVVDIWIDGEPMDMQSHYSIAMASFLAAGGDGYTMLANPITGEFSSDSDTLIRYIEREGNQAFSIIGDSRSQNVG